MITFLSRLSRRQSPPVISLLSTRHYLSTTASSSSSKLRTEYAFVAPPSLHPQTPHNNSNFQPGPEPVRPADQAGPSIRLSVQLHREQPKFQAHRAEGAKILAFRADRVDREWTGVCAPAVDPRVGSAGVDGELEKKRRLMREKVQGEPLTNAERKALFERCQRHKTKRQINLGRDGLTHNMLNDIHNNWKHTEAVRIKCMGVPTVDMKNICAQLEDKTFGQIIHRHGGLLVLYRGRYYTPKERPVIPLMLWKPQEPVYPRLIKTTIDGLSIEETKEMRKRGLSVPALTRLEHAHGWTR
ncbi:crs2-associated factor 1 mitochondrial [Phtheirospermum japonicum]|uniref:Crs2-associated factor 1 mitochondrial n=1 Tax=Phtheirospermum japonicum TaxID=374723 RepID=A0A830B8S7_9LAMI|nr:crs2-associated factor 1 mitochondrial [Phtheirospermum japonicum]